jgi:hypothetical protein
LTLAQDGITTALQHKHAPGKFNDARPPPTHSCVNTGLSHKVTLGHAKFGFEGVVCALTSRYRPLIGARAML